MVGPLKPPEFAANATHAEVRDWLRARDPELDEACDEVDRSLIADTLRLSWRERLVDLPALVEIKAGTGRTRDRLTVPILVALLEARERGESLGDDQVE